MPIAIRPLLKSLTSLISTLLLLIPHILYRLIHSPRRRRPPTSTIGFLHPHPLSGGGGERVLWSALISLHKLFPSAKLILYSPWTASSIPLTHAVSTSRATVRAQFGLDLSSLTFHPVDLPHHTLVDPTQYPHLTLLFQAIGATRLGALAFAAHPVHLFVDTANLAFAHIVPCLRGAQTMSYVHYPTISTHMLQVVRDRRPQFNNSSRIAASPHLSMLKLAYYRLFASLYAVAARCVHVAVANSSWTKRHLVQLWRRGDVRVVFPPCADVGGGDVGGGGREEGLIVSVGQFRPEKRHDVQVEVVSRLVQGGVRGVRLVMVGGTRNEADRRRAEELRVEIERRRLPVQVLADASLEELRGWLRRGVVGLHTMEDEHFGISVVELQRFGLIVVAHRSGGVALDIVREGENGFLAGGLEEYVEQVRRVLAMGEEERDGVRRRARENGERFSQAEFERHLAEVVAERLGVVTDG